MKNFNKKKENWTLKALDVQGGKIHCEVQVKWRTPSKKVRMALYTVVCYVSETREIGQGFNRMGGQKCSSLTGNSRALTGFFPFFK